MKLRWKHVDSSSWAFAQEDFFITKQVNYMNYVRQIMPALIAGAWLTLRIFFWTLLISLPLGILVALG